MDLVKILDDLRTERERLVKIISALEALHGRHPKAAAPAKRRGRKFMDAADRKAVSLRMKRYWEARRQQQSPPAEGNSAAQGASK